MNDFTAYYRDNASVHETLTSIDPSTYQKYVDWMSVPQHGARLLDVGCGTGTVVQLLAARGYDVIGVDPNRISLAEARKSGLGSYIETDSYQLPFADASFDVVGSYTVLEHMGEPDVTLSEQIRVLRPGGRLVVACPNFGQVMGLASHHPRTRGVKRKAINAKFLASRAILWTAQRRYRFEMMPPISRQIFEPDDDAIVVTNPIDVAAALIIRGMRITYRSGTDRYFPTHFEWLGAVPFIRSLIGAVFMVAEKPVL